MKRLLLGAAGAALGLALFAAHPAGLLGPQGATCAAAAGNHHVALVVQHNAPNGAGQTVLTACVAFDQATSTFDAAAHTISAEEVLRLSGIQFGTADYGATYGVAVCQVDGEPASYTPRCLEPGPSRYWFVFASAYPGSGWNATNHGVSNVRVGDGDAVGLRYEADPSGQPPAPSGICPAPAPWTAPPTTSPQKPAPATTIPQGPTSRPTPASAAATATSPPPSPDQSPTPASPPTSPSPRPPVATRAASGSSPGLLGWIAAAVIAVLLGGLAGMRLLRQRG